MTISAVALAVASVAAWFLITPGRVQPETPPAAPEAEAEAELAAV